MDKKYTISTIHNEEENREMINWVSIKTNDYLDIRHIDVTSEEEYQKDLNAIDTEYGDFFKALFSSDYNTQSEEQFMSEQNAAVEEDPEKRQTASKITETEEELEIITKENHSNAKRAIAAIAATAAAAYLLFNSKFGPLNAEARAKWEFGFGDENNRSTTTEQTLENGVIGSTESNDSESTEVAEADEKEPLNAGIVTDAELNNKSIGDLLNMLNTDGQKQAIAKITEGQDDFNMEAASTVKQVFTEDGKQIEKQLFVTFDETSAAYLYANAFAVPADDLAMYFGNAKVFDRIPNGVIKESLNQDIVTANYVNFSKQLIQYYQLGGKVHTGMDQLFENQEEGKFFYDFESLVLEYNKTKDEKTAKAIREQLEEIYMAGTNNSIKDKFPGATALISTTMLPHLHTNGVINNEKMETYEEIYETKTCNDIKNQIKKVEEKINCEVSDCINTATKVNGKERILEKIDEIQDKQTLKLDRNMNMTNAIEGYRLEDLEGATIVNGVLVDGGAGVTTTESSEVHESTNSRSEAVSSSSESQVAQAESAANADLEAKNKEEDAYWEKIVAENNANAEAEAERQRAEYDRTHDVVQKTETEEYFVPEKTSSQTESTSTYTEEQHYEEVTYEEPVQQVISYTTEETVEEEWFVEEEQGKAKTR